MEMSLYGQFVILALDSLAVLLIVLVSLRKTNEKYPQTTQANTK